MNESDSLPILPLSSSFVRDAHFPLSCFEKVHIAYLFFFRHKQVMWPAGPDTQWERCSHNLNFSQKQWDVSQHVQNIKCSQSPGDKRPFHIYIYTNCWGQRQKKRKKEEEEEVEEETTQYPVSVVYWEQLSAASKPIGLDQRRWKRDLIAMFRLPAVNRGRKGQIMLFRIRALDWHQWLFLQAERALGHSSGTWTSSPTAQKKHSWGFWVGFLPCHEML